MSGQQERKTPEGTSYKDLVLTVTSVTTSIITTTTNSSLAFNLRQKGKYSLKCLYNLHFLKLKDTSKLTRVLYYAC